MPAAFLNWLQYAENRLAPMCRKRIGSITPKIGWLLYAENEVAPIWRKMTGNHAQLVVVKAIIDPDKRRIPIQFARQSQRNAMSGSVYRILRWVELDARALL
jgi:hypothetical protein